MDEVPVTGDRSTVGVAAETANPWNEEFYQTQYALLKSRSLSEAVVRDLGLADNYMFLADFDPDAERARYQAQANHEFEAQPDRHPHRMVHYGHFLFRPLNPLAAFEGSCFGIQLRDGKTFDLLISQHCEDHHLTAKADMHEGAVSTRLGLRGWPASGEDMIVARNILLAELTGTKVHCRGRTARSCAPAWPPAPRRRASRTRPPRARR